MRVFLNSFIWKTSSSPKKKLLSPNFRELHVFLSRYMLAKILKKNVDVWYPQIVPGVWSSSHFILRQLHFKMLVLAHLHRSVLTQQVHSLGHLAFKWRSSFAKALAKLSPNFREKSPNSFYKMIHIYIINTKYKYLQCNLDMYTWTFAKTFAKKILSPFQKKTLAETAHYIPKGLRKGNPFHGPFAQLSYLFLLRQIYV